jgi:hypothetical protein
MQPTANHHILSNYITIVGVSPVAADRSAMPLTIFTSTIPSRREGIAAANWEQCIDAILDPADQGMGKDGYTRDCTALLITREKGTKAIM